MSAHIKRPTVEQSLASQKRKLKLITCGGMNGYRVAFVGGPDFETLAEFDTQDEAWTVLKHARAALSCL